MTLPARDSLTSIESRYRALESDALATQERFKRLSTEMGARRAEAVGSKQSIEKFQSEIANIQARIEQLEAQRLEINQRLADENESLMRLLESKRGAEEATKHQRDAVEEVDEQLRELRQEIELKGRALRDAENDKRRALERLNELRRGALEAYLSESAGVLVQSIGGLGERAARVKAAAALRDARHSGGRVADLCDQRDQYLELLRVASVPGVRDTLGVALRSVENEIERAYPGALLAVETGTDEVSCELHYFVDQGGVVSIILPFGGKVWEALQRGDRGPEAESLVKLVFSLIRGARLKPGDGEFSVDGGRVVYRAAFDVEAMVALATTGVQPDSETPVRIGFAPLPADVVEALQ